ncbi:alpha/beta hydrolase [Blastococcus sp. MG754426]|uniref:alpha/beta fold hydrolase n=1 Tax=unclassified Blastococcus TaxID=2619396 RepID=UPI001EF0C7EE|nr:MULTISPECIES: alpha/beta hydrolase [unclassified Blastococcus]MCF6507438.1 alpha/beta hydrolase [Blastococcus sp. MG754426]MCF6512014.1 alpha/beta hydrolase [Blastococcus sp. MG754427]MCF6734945.1 alpha/beta hydrolase [Blastococcus sp. KM273129]
MRTDAEARQASIRLRDGRTLAWAEHGDPDGWPVLGCHGSPSSRLERHVEDPADYRRWGVRFIVPDRPGFGRSDPHPGRRVADWPDDVAQLLDHLGVERCAALSLSGGAAYALACAHALGDRVTTVGILGGAPPPDVPWPWPRWIPGQLRAAVHRPGRLAAVLRPVFAPIGLRPAMIPRYLQLRLNAADRRVIGRPAVRRVLADTFTEGLRNGSGVLAEDRALLFRPWGFPLAEIGQQVHVWHGTQDWQVPVVLGQVLSAMLPRCSARWLPGEGHFLVFDHAEEVYAALRP